MDPLDYGRQSLLISLAGEAAERAARRRGVDLTSRFVIRAAWHEAGHAITASHVGWAVRELRVGTDRTHVIRGYYCGGSTRVTVPPLDSSVAVPQTDAAPPAETAAPTESNPREVPGDRSAAVAYAFLLSPEPCGWRSALALIREANHVLDGLMHARFEHLQRIAYALLERDLTAGDFQRLIGGEHAA